MASEGSELNMRSRKDETNDYLKNHQILELFNNLLSKLIFERPADPQNSMIKQLEALENCKPGKKNYPCLFDDSNIQSLFCMLDPTNKGHITFKQYIEAFRIVSVKEYNQNPDGYSDDRISFDTFLQEVRDALQKACANFKQ